MDTIDNFVAEQPSNIFQGLRVPDVKCSFGSWQKTFDTTENEQWRGDHKATYEVSLFPWSADTNQYQTLPAITKAFLEYFAALGIFFEKPYEVNSSSPATRKFLMPAYFDSDVWFSLDLIFNKLEITPEAKRPERLNDYKAGIEMFLDDLHAYAQSKQTREL